MARSRRYNRRSSSQRAASLLALALPAPMQRVADTRLGPLLMLLGIPTALVGGLLNINWDNGQPQLSIDPARAAEIRNATQQEWQRLGNSGLGQTATEFWNNYTNSNSSSLLNTQPSNSYAGVQQNHQAGFPSTSPRNSANGQTPYGQLQNNSRSANGTYMSSQGYQAQAYPSQGYQTQVSSSGYPQSAFGQINNSQYANSQYAHSYQQTHPPYTSAQQYPNQSTALTQQYAPYQQPAYQQNQFQPPGYQQPASSPYTQQTYQQTYPGQYQQPMDTQNANPLQNNQQYNQSPYNQQQYPYPSLDPSLSQSHWNNQQARSNSFPQPYVGSSSSGNLNSGWQVSQSPSAYGQQPAYTQPYTASPSLNSRGRY